MDALKLLQLALFLNLFSNPNKSKLWSETEKLQSFPPSCNRIECPSYDVIEMGNGYEIRRYNSPIWISTSKIQDISLVEATRTGFMLVIFDKAVQVNYKAVDHLASSWCEWAEMDLRHKNFKGALELMPRATAEPSVEVKRRGFGLRYGRRTRFHV